MGSEESVPAAFLLTVVDGHGLLSFQAPSPPSSSSTAPAPTGGIAWAAIETLDLEIGNDDAGHGTGHSTGLATAGGGAPDAVAGLQSRRLALRRATLQTDVARLAGALEACTLAYVGVREVRVWMAPDGPRLVGRFRVGNREAPFTIRIGIEPRVDGRRRLRISLADVRLFAHLPLPAPLVGAAIARGIAKAVAGSNPVVRAQGPAIDIDPLELALVFALVTRGWRLPNIKRGWLESVDRSNGELRLRFGCDGHPTEKVATLEQNTTESEEAPPTLPFLEGERLPDGLVAAEQRLQAGDLVAAELGYRQALADNPDDCAAQGRLLALRSATGGADAAQISGAMMGRWPQFLPGFLYGAITALELGDAARAATLFGRAAALADQRGEVEDATLARAAETAARTADLSARARGGASTEPAAILGADTRPFPDAPPHGPATDDAERSKLVEQIERAIARGELAEVEGLFDRRLALARDDEETASLTTERARVQMLGTGGAPRALRTLRGMALALTPEEGLVLRADLAERVGDLADARQSLGELLTRAVATGDMSRARELSAHQALLSAPHTGEHATPLEVVVDALAEAVPARAEGGDSGNVTAKTEAVYATRSDPELRAEALGDLLEGFEHLPPQRQHAAYASFGRVAESTGDLDNAEEAYWRATHVEGDPARRANDLMAHARVLLSRGNVAAAVTELEHALVLDPGHAGVLALLADQAFTARDWERSRHLYALLDVAADAADAIPRETLVHRRAVLARQAQDAAEAEACYRELAILNPRHVEARQTLAQIALERGDPRTAAERLEEVLRLLPLDALEGLLDVRQRLGEIYAGLSDWGAARYYVELVLAQDPGRLPMIERLAEVYEHLGLHAAAADTFDRMARLYRDPARRAEALFRAGEILEEHLGDEARAFDAYLKSSDLNPGFAPTALRLVGGYWRRGAFGDVAEIGEDLHRSGPLPPMELELRLRLAMGTALARGDVARAAAVAELHASPWNADRAAAALAEIAAQLSARPPHDLEPATALLEAWRGISDGGQGQGGAPPTDWLSAALRAQITKDPGAVGAARAWGWLADRRGDTHTARGLFAMVSFVDEEDGAFARLAELGPAPTPTAAAISLGAAADHPGARGPAAPLRRALEALARGLAGFGPLGPAARRTPTGDLGLQADRRDRLHALARTFGAPALALVTGTPRPRTPGDDVEATALVTVVATRPATIEIPSVLTNIPEDELTFLVARAFDRLRGGMALVDTATNGSSDDVASLLAGARAALTGDPAPDAPLARSVAQELASPDRTAALVGTAARDAVIAEIDRARDVLPTWDAFRAAADRASDRFAIVACRSPLAALRALYRGDSVVAPGARQRPERVRRIDFLRTARVRELLRFVGSDEYVRALSDADPASPVDD